MLDEFSIDALMIITGGDALVDIFEECVWLVAGDDAAHGYRMLKDVVGIPRNGDG